MFENYTYLRFDKTNVLRQGVLTPCEIKKLKLPNRSIMKIKLINFSKILFFIICIMTSFYDLEIFKMTVLTLTYDATDFTKVYRKTT